MPIIYDQSGLGQAQNCLSTQMYYQDPFTELRSIVRRLEEATEPKDEKVKRLEARISELEAKLAAVKQAAL